MPKIPEQYQLADAPTKNPPFLHFTTWLSIATLQNWHKGLASLHIQ